MMSAKADDYPEPEREKLRRLMRFNGRRYRHMEIARVGPKLHYERNRTIEVEAEAQTHGQNVDVTLAYPTALFKF